MDPVEAAIEAGHQAWAESKSIITQELAAQIVRAAAAILIQHGRHLAAVEIEAYQPAAHPVVCPPAIAYQAAMETAARIARGGTS